MRDERDAQTDALNRTLGLATDHAAQRQLGHGRAGDGAAAHPPGMALEWRACRGVTDETVAAQLGGTDNVLSELAWPTPAATP